MARPKVRIISQIVVGLLSIVLFDYSSGLDMESAKERSCFEVKKVAPVDTNWSQGVKSWYFPMMTRFDLYRWAVDLVRMEPEDVSEYDLYYKGCMQWNFVGDDFEVDGFHGKSATYESKTTGNGFDNYQFSNKEGKGNGGSCFITDTDNSTYLVSTCCLKGDQMVWEVSSTTKSLPEETIKTIHDHVKSLGFKEKYFTGIRYETCEPAKER